jgi:hypothetical protein
MPGSSSLHGNNRTRGRCEVTFRYMANLQGAPAVATITFQQLYSYVYKSGNVRSARAAYSFHADIYGDGGYGQMLDEYRGSAFRSRCRILLRMASS